MEDNSNKKQDFTVYGRTIRLSQEIIDHISPQIKYPESFSNTLERILKLKKLEKKNVSSRTNKKT